MFVDCSLRKVYGRSKSGKRITNQNTIKSTLGLTVLAAINWSGTLDFICLDGPYLSKDFAGFICLLIKNRKLGGNLDQVYFFCDNATIHKSNFVQM